MISAKDGEIQSLKDEVRYLKEKIDQLLEMISSLKMHNFARRQFDEGKSRKPDDAMKTKEQYIHLLSEFRKSRGSVYGISRIGIFGSVARGEQKEGSDVDIYYEGEPLSLFKLAALKEELETTLESPVDIVRIRKSMNWLLGKRIKKEGLYV